MKILHISTRLIQGGSQENTLISCEGQVRRGHEVHLAYGPIYGPEGSMLERAQSFRNLDDHAIHCHEVADMVREVDPLRDLKCLSALKRLIRDIKPDIVHTHSSKAGILGRIAAWQVGGKRGEIGVVHTIHGPPFHTYESAWNNHIYILCEKIAAKHCHRIISVADAMTKQFLEKKIGHPDQYCTIYSGIEVEQFLKSKPGESRDEMREKLGFKPDDVVIGTVSRLAELKGHDDVLDALSEDLKVRANWKLLWVGDGWWRERLMSRVKSMQLDGRVVVTGMVPPEGVPGMMRAMDVLVHPSYREGLPRTVPQALLAGVPVVAYDTDGTSEACMDFETGRLVGPGDVRALRDAINWMLEQPARARETMQRGRSLCQRRFASETMQEELERVYGEVVSGAMV